MDETTQVSYECAVSFVEALLEQHLEGSVFEALGTREFPASLGHLLDEEVLVVGLGLELGADTFQRGLEFVGILDRVEDEAGGEAVTGGVAAGSRFAGFGARTGGIQGVATICGDLCVGWHAIQLEHGRGEKRIEGLV